MIVAERIRAETGGQSIMTYIKKFGGFSIFQVEGSLAALIDEGVWERMLKGETILVMEPDAERWTLFKNGSPIRIVTATSMEAACQKFVELSPAFAQTAALILDDRLPVESWEIRAGYPNYLNMSQEQADEHAAAGRDDARKIAAFYRKLIEENTKGMIAAEEIDRFGMKKEGKN
jgi:hypothetical protein